MTIEQHNKLGKKLPTKTKKTKKWYNNMYKKVID